MTPESTRPSPPDEPPTAIPPDGVDTRPELAPDDLGTHPAVVAKSSPCPIGPPGFELIRILGRGGVGVVYLAHQAVVNRPVALKALLRADASPAALARFWAEAEVMGAVAHPNVVRVYQLGTHDGRPFLVMEYVDGGNLSTALRAGDPLPPRRAAELVGQIARGVAAAHQLGVVHRDLKPANVLLTTDGVPKVTDFGLAKRQAHDLTDTQALMGTPAYMSPEQAGGRAKFVGPPADVWALGVILYEAAGGVRPFAAPTVSELLSQIQQAEPLPLRTRSSSVPRDLDTILAKCLAKEPEHRYPTAAEVADDLERFVRGEPIAARPVSVAERVVRWARRKPAAAAAYALTSVAGVLVAVVLVVFGMWREADRAKRDAEAARDEADGLRQQADDGRREEARLRGVADDATREAVTARNVLAKEREQVARMEYGRTMQVAYQEWKDGRVIGPRELLAAARPDLRGWEWRFLHRLCHSDEATFVHHTMNVSGVTVAPAGGWAVSGSDDGTAVVFDPGTGKVRHTLRGHSDKVYAVAASPDGTLVATGGLDGKAVVWSADTGKRRITLPGHAEVVRRVLFTADGRWVVTVDDAQTRVWDAKTGELVRSLGHGSGGTDAALGPGGRVAVAHRGSAAVWDLAGTGKVLELASEAMNVAWSVGGEHLATAGYSGKLTVYRLATADGRPTAAPVGTARGGVNFYQALAFDPTGTLLAQAGQPVVHLWKLDGTPVGTFRSHQIRARGVCFNSDGDRLLSCGDDGMVKLWPVPERTENHRTMDAAVGIRPDWGRFARLSDGRCVICSASGEVLVRLKGDRFPATTEVRWSPDTLRLVTIEDKVARVWDAQTGEAVATFSGHVPPISPIPAFGEIGDAAFSPDGRRVLTASRDWTARVWDATTGKSAVTLRGHVGPVRRATWNRDGTRIATCGDDGRVVVWDAADGKLLHGFVHPLPVLALAFSPDGTRLASAGDDMTVRVWDVDAKRQVHALKGHSGFVLTVAWHPTEPRLVSGGEDRAAKVWDMVSGAEVLALKGHAGPVRSAGWDAAGHRLLTTADVEPTADRTQAVRIWDSAAIRRQVQK